MSPVPHYESENIETISKPSRTETSSAKEEVTIENKEILPPEEIKEPDKDCDEKMDICKIEDDSTDSITEQITPAPPVTLDVKSYNSLNGVDLFEELECEKRTDNDIRQSDSVICDKKQSERVHVMNGDQTPSDISQSDGPHLTLPRDTSMDTLGEASVVNNLADIAQRDIEACGCPLQLFDDVS